MAKLKRCKYGMIVGSFSVCSSCREHRQAASRELPAFEAEQDAEREALIVGLHLPPPSVDA